MKIKLSKSQWSLIGKSAGWTREAIMDLSNEPEMPSNEEKVTPSGKLNIEIRKYSTRTWGVYANGRLLCVTVYRKGAMAVKEIIDQMSSTIENLKNKSV